MDGWMDGLDGWMDGWMDGWSRPNHMPSRLDALQTMHPVNFRRLVGGSQSVAKQASFNIASGSDFGVFRRFWGGQNAKFGRFFSSCFSNAMLASIFGCFL